MTRIDALLAGLLMVSLPAALAVSADQPVTISGFVETVGADGDSLKLSGDRHVVLWGISPVASDSCPKPFGGYWSCGMVAANRLYTMVRRDATVTCEVKTARGSAPPVAVCSNLEGDLAGRLVASGWARAAEAYQDEEVSARSEKLGIWIWRQER